MSILFIERIPMVEQILSFRTELPKTSTIWLLQSKVFVLSIEKNCSLNFSDSKVYPYTYWTKTCDYLFVLFVWLITGFYIFFFADMNLTTRSIIGATTTRTTETTVRTIGTVQGPVYCGPDSAHCTNSLETVFGEIIRSVKLFFSYQQSVPQLTFPLQLITLL